MTATIRALEGELPKHDSLPTEFAHTATVEIAALEAAAQRVALVSTKKNAPIKLTFIGGELTIAFTAPTKPAVLRGHGSDDQALRYPLIRLTI
ncbi:hypothetical protein [Streptomyces sp. NPDC000351]|uniref:hypothetical protein n=1 Tax=Streptomyces sp. NPDC000351 TaxID=3154250 RepID=UPI0033303439